jgi:RNA polymerase-binding transcription factor DksA
MVTETMSLKERLQQELDEARAELERLEKQRLEGKGDYGLGTGDPNIYEWEMCLALKQRVENRIASLEEALRKAEDGSYGRCEVCGQPIDPARLAILPSTKRCINCAQKRS